MRATPALSLVLSPAIEPVVPQLWPGLRCGTASEAVRVPGILGGVQLPRVRPIELAEIDEE